MKGRQFKLIFHRVPVERVVDLPHGFVWHEKKRDPEYRQVIYHTMRVERLTDLEVRDIRKMARAIICAACPKSKEPFKCYCLTA